MARADKSQRLVTAVSLQSGMKMASGGRLSGGWPDATDLRVSLSGSPMSRAHSQRLSLSPPSLHADLVLEAQQRRAPCRSSDTSSTCRMSLDLHGARLCGAELFEFRKTDLLSLSSLLSSFFHDLWGLGHGGKQYSIVTMPGQASKTTIKICFQHRAGFELRRV